MSRQKPRIGITIGDLNGIGPEVVMKALADNRMLDQLTPVIYGSTRVLSYYKKMLGITDFSYTQVKTPGQYNSKNINVVNCWEEVIEIKPGTASKEAGRASFLALKQACEELKEGHIDALVTAPIDKQSIHSENFPFKGHTEYLTQFFGASDSLMFMISENLKVSLVTEHVSIQEVTALITKSKIESKIKILEQSLKKDFLLGKPRIAVLGLNPHAGDSGLIGKEDDELIAPVVIDLKNKGKLVYGPYSADGFFGTKSYLKFDAVLAMYHDQGLIPFKTIAFEDGVNFTAGLSIVRTSPDHGTAYSIAGKNQADEASMRLAIYKACDIFSYREEQSKEK